MSEFLPNQEFEARKQQFKFNLADFVIEASRKGWAADAPKVDNPERPGFKELTYQRDEWEYRDSYAGYFMGPGSSVVYLKNRPVWYMSYGGDGLHEEHYPGARDVYAFLHEALMEPNQLMPVRGPQNYWGPDKKYEFDFEGDILNGSWTEKIELFTRKDRHTIFSQLGEVGLIIDKDQSRLPVYPWDL